MTNREIEKNKQELYEIQRIPERSKQLEPIQTLAKRVNAPIPLMPPDMRRADSEIYFINEITRNIHIVLQTEEMFNACIFAKWSCFWAAVAATVACISVVITMCLN
jgi:hypothetical protein